MMQPGRELDALVARVMGQSVTFPESYSEEDEPAMQAWAWLEENHPWTQQGNAWPWQQGIKAAILLGRDYSGQEDNPRPSVLVMQRADWWCFPDDEIEEGTKEGRCFFIPGTTYPHAIALAVVEAGKALGVQNEKA